MPYGGPQATVTCTARPSQPTRARARWRGPRRGRPRASGPVVGARQPEARTQSSLPVAGWVRHSTVGPARPGRAYGAGHGHGAMPWHAAAVTVTVAPGGPQARRRVNRLHGHGCGPGVPGRLRGRRQLLALMIDSEYGLGPGQVTDHSFFTLKRLHA